MSGEYQWQMRDVHDPGVDSYKYFIQLSLSFFVEFMGESHFSF